MVGDRVDEIGETRGCVREWVRVGTRVCYRAKCLLFVY